MLNKVNRLPGKVRIKEGSKFSSRFFLLKFQRNSNNVSRFGFVVPKTISKRSVDRNKIKRCLRRCVEKNLSKIKPGMDFLIIAKKEIVKANFNLIFFEFNKVFKKNNLIE